MATLDAKKRASLPDSAFAYVDSRGSRRLPIHDEAHVRNALSRFNQVKYESDEARERTFRKLLKAASQYGIAPVGFVTRRLSEARGDTPSNLPSGLVTLMMTDIEGSTSLVHDLGDDYPTLLEEVRDLIRENVNAHNGYEVDSRADEFFAVFGQAFDAVETAIGIQRQMGGSAWPGGRQVRVRIGLHSGSPAVTDTGYVGLPVHVMARVCSAGHGGQVLVTNPTREVLGDSMAKAVELNSLGVFQLSGLPHTEELFQMQAPGLATDFPALRVADSDG